MTWSGGKLNTSKKGWAKGHILQVGLRTTRDAALQWEGEQRKQGKPTGP